MSAHGTDSGGAWQRHEKERLARLIARDFERVSFEKPSITLLPGFTWEGIERLARRVELLPEDLATLLVLHSVGCTALDSETEYLASRVVKTRGDLN